MGKKIFEITATVRFKLTEEDVTDLVVGALEGGIGYWSILDNSGKEFTDAPKEEAISETAARILIEDSSMLKTKASPGFLIWKSWHRGSGGSSKKGMTSMAYSAATEPIWGCAMRKAAIRSSSLHFLIKSYFAEWMIV